MKINCSILRHISNGTACHKNRTFLFCFAQKQKCWKFRCLWVWCLANTNKPWKPIEFQEPVGTKQQFLFALLSSCICFKWTRHNRSCKTAKRFSWFLFDELWTVREFPQPNKPKTTSCCCCFCCTKPMLICFMFCKFQVCCQKKSFIVFIESTSLTIEQSIKVNTHDWVKQKHVRQQKDEVLRIN